MFLLCFLLTYALFHALLDDLDPNAQTAAAYFGLFALASVWICVKQKRFPRKALLPGLLCPAMCLGFVLHNDPDLHPVLFLLLIPLSGFYCIALTGANVHAFGSFYILLDLVRCELLLPLRHLFAPFTARIDAIKARRAAKATAKKRKAWVPVAVGLLAAIPVLLLVIPLLIDADAAFESFAGTAFASVEKALQKTGDLLSAYLSFDFFALFSALLFTPYILAVMFSFAHGTAKAENADTSAKYRKLRRAPLPFFAALLGVVSAVYVIYLLSQTAYFFSAFSGRLPAGVQITVTEYARRGFFEMVKLAGVNFVLIALSVGFCRRNGNRLPKTLRGLNAFLCAFTMLLCAISISKIILYIRAYGLTEKRLYVFAADLALLFVFGAILLRLFVEKFPYMKVILAAVFLSAATLGLLGVNNTIARYNTRGLLNGTLKSYSVTDLSNDCGDAAFPYLQKIAASGDPLAAEAQEALRQSARYYTYDSFADKSFQNLEQARHTDFVRKTLDEADSFQLEVSLDIPNEKVYALSYSCALDNESVLGGGLAHADNSPLSSTEIITIARADLPENADLSKLSISFALRLTPDDADESVPVEYSSETMPDGIGYGKTCPVTIVQSEDGSFMAW